MNSHRKTAILIGIFFIIGTVAGILGLVFTGSFLGDPEYLTSIAMNENNIILGALCILTMGFALTMVPVLLYPIFKSYNATLALGAVVFRGALETAVYIGQAVILFLLLVLSQEYLAADPGGLLYLQSLGAVILKIDGWVAHITSIVFSLGALMIYAVFYQSKLVPRWLSVWGLIGGVLYFVSPLAGMFGFEWGFLMLPLALQEMVLAFWLIIKGFDSKFLAA